MNKTTQGCIVASCALIAFGKFGVTQAQQTNMSFFVTRARPPSRGIRRIHRAVPAAVAVRTT
jgi:hypothetical protein